MSGIVKWQRHPSTLTGHAFIGDSRDSVCKRERRMNGGEEYDLPGTFCCSRCQKGLIKLVRELEKAAICDT